MLQDEQDVGNEETDFRIKICCLGRIFWAADKLQQIQKENEPVKEKSFHGGISRTYLSLANKWKPCHGPRNSRPHNLRTALEKYFWFQWNCKQLRKPCHGAINSWPRNPRRAHWKSTFDFSEIVNNYGFKRGTVWKIVRFISQFSLKLYIQFWKYFHNMILGKLGRGYCKKQQQQKKIGC